MLFMQYCVENTLSCYYFDGSKYNDLNPIRYFIESHHHLKQIGGKYHSKML